MATNTTDAISIANPLQTLGSFADQSVLPATTSAAATPASATPSAPTVTTPAAVAAQDPVKAAADQAKESQNAFADAWGAATSTASTADTTPTAHRDGGLNLSAEAKQLKADLEAKGAVIAQPGSVSNSQTPLTPQDEYTKAWLDEHNGAYGTLKGGTLATNDVVQQSFKNQAPELTEGDRRLFQQALLRPDMLTNSGYVSNDIHALHGEAMNAARQYGLSDAKIQALWEEGREEREAQSEFERRWKEYDGKRQLDLERSMPSGA